MGRCPKTKVNDLLRSVCSFLPHLAYSAFAYGTFYNVFILHIYFDWSFNLLVAESDFFGAEQKQKNSHIHSLGPGTEI